MGSRVHAWVVSAVEYLKHFMMILGIHAGTYDSNNGIFETQNSFFFFGCALKLIFSHA